MALDLPQFFQATNPSKTLRAGNPEDDRFYIDFSSVRGGRLIEELKDMIALDSTFRLIIPPNPLIGAFP